MQSRALHALLSYVLFLCAAMVVASLTGIALDSWRVAFWSMIGIASYIALSQLFGFDPHRTRIAEYGSALARYVDRWELRQGQAALSMLGCVVITAGLIDAAHLITAVLCGTLSAWTYFALRLYAGGYRKPDRLRRSSR